MKRLIFIATLFVTAPTYAQQASGDHSAPHPAPVQAQAQKSLVDGEVRIGDYVLTGGEPSHVAGPWKIAEIRACDESWWLVIWIFAKLAMW